VRQRDPAGTATRAEITSSGSRRVEDRYTRVVADREWQVSVKTRAIGATPSTPRKSSDNEVTIGAHMLPPNQQFTAYASDGTHTVALMSMTSNELGSIDEALSYSYFFANRYTSVSLRPGPPS
jgi:hypothetical protein